MSNKNVGKVAHRFTEPTFFFGDIFIEQFELKFFTKFN
jgi:hypothetical protein